MSSESKVEKLELLTFLTTSCMMSLNAFAVSNDIMTVSVYMLDNKGGSGLAAILVQVEDP